VCGRFTLYLSHLDELRIELDVDELLIADWKPRYNIAPTQDAPVLRLNTAGGRQADLLRWGLLPRWAKDPGAGARAINARVESVADKPTFRDAFRRRRCLVPASGFYEWQPLPGQRKKQPMLIYPRDESLVTFAGIWDEWTSSLGEVIESFSIVTTEAAGELRAVHDRMPLMLRGAHRERWLERAPLSQAELSSIVTACADTSALATHAVGTQVNTATYDAPDCIEPSTPDDERQLDLFGVV
jgi:putative SOS response-associated peptidase YedK